jgi:hypothetical protein
LARAVLFGFGTIPIPPSKILHDVVMELVLDERDPVMFNDGIFKSSPGCVRERKDLDLPRFF